MKRKRDYNEGVVKCCLKKYLKKPQLFPYIQKWVLHVSKIAHRGSLFFNHYILSHLEKKEELPDLTDQMVYQQCFTMGMSNFRKSIGDLKEFFINTEELHPFFERIPGDTQAIMYASQQYMVNFFNSLIFTFEGRQKGAVKVWNDNRENKLNPKELRSVICHINGWNSRYNWKIDKESKKYIKEQRKLLGLKDEEEITKTWLKIHPVQVLKYFYSILCLFEKSEKKLFNIAPISTIRNHFLTIDTVVLYNLLKNLKLFEGTISKFKEQSEEYFRGIFNIDKLSNQPFGCLVETDGISLCVHFHKPKEETSNRELKKNSERVIAIDPGRTNLIFGVEELGMGDYKTWCLKKSQYYHDSHFFKNKRKNERWNAQIQKIIDKFSNCTSKTTKSSEFIKFLELSIKYSKKLWTFYTQKKMGMLRMDNYIHKRKTLDKFFSSMWRKGEKKPTVAYGAAKFNPTSKNELSAPTTHLSSRCSSCYKTVFVDEFRTSKCCHACGEELKVLKRKVNDKIREIRGLRCCSSSNCLKVRLISRDLNAALNILTCFRTGTNRPKHLSRKHSDE